MIMRKARLNKSSWADAPKLKSYLPANYSAVFLFTGISYEWFIVGFDNAGWTLDGYVLPRLASGLIFAEEIK